MKPLSITAAVEPYICTPCLLRRATRITSYARFIKAQRHAGIGSTSPRQTRQTTPSLALPSTQYLRRASTVTLASSTAINAPSSVPPKFRRLHSELQTLLKSAAGHVDVSRVQLALKSLETETPVIRIALLGLGTQGTNAARKLARAILTDVLGEEQIWEKELTDAEHGGKSLLLRYGEFESLSQNASALRTISIPSEWLQKHRIEFLITGLNPETRSKLEDKTGDTLEDFALVPALPTPTSSDGRVVFVRYPVHRALVVADGIEGAMDMGSLGHTMTRDILVHKAVNLPLRKGNGGSALEAETVIDVVDADLAIHALSVFRKSNSNGAQYGDEWNKSRVASLADWMINNSDAHSEVQLNSVLRRSIDSTLDSTLQNITRAEADADAAIQSSTIPQAKRIEISEAVKSWSANAHRDLQLNLSDALESRAWKRIAWFRLLWRIDDVSASIGDILRLQWLTQAEQTLAYLSGRIVESGLASPTELKETAATPASTEEDMQLAQAVEEAQEENRGTAAVLLQMPTVVSRLQQDTSAAHGLYDPPWPHTIFLNRQQMLNNVVPAMHRKAQTLLLSTLSTVGGTGALGAWVWVASAGTMLNEAGAIAALGLAWSLRRLQKLWERERSQFATVLHEDGRRVLGEIDARLQALARDGGKAVPSQDESARESILGAREAVENCRKALQKVE